MKKETPSEEIFTEMKLSAIKIWSSYDNNYGYVTEKLNKVNYIKNIQDNAMVFYRMLDSSNQQKMINLLSEKSLDYIYKNK